VATLHGPFRQKFGIPRQPGLAPVVAEVVLHPPHDHPDTVRGLEAFSHLWLIFLFHAHRPHDGATVRPPRLGGRERRGVFATRSGHRPNPVGLSAVRLLDIDAETGHLRVEGADLLDGTPILDIKPYVPYADCIPEADPGFAGDAPGTHPVVFSHEAELVLAGLADGDRLRRELAAVLALDPRPAHQTDGAREYRMRYGEFDVVMDCEDDRTIVRSLRPLEP
jgi:tRNA-Thr(GGU) m(6)t(6)A37 methyltransferase TsaA